MDEKVLQCVEPNPIWDYTYSENHRYWLNVYGETVYNRMFAFLWFVPVRKWRMQIARRVADRLIYNGNDY